MADFRKVEELLEGAVGPVFPAAQLVVVDRFQPVLSRAVGDCDPQTRFDIASLTKPLSTVALTMMALEEGRLKLDDRPRAEMTVRQLLAHASGLPACLPLGDSRAAVLQTVATVPLEAAPGSRSRYSDLGFILLGATVERALDAPLDEAFATRIARPLGVTAGFCPADPAACAPTEGGLQGTVHDENARAMGGVAGHAGLFATAQEVSRLAHAWVAAYHGVRSPLPRLWPPARVRQFWSSAGIPESTWCLGWDRPAAVGSSAGTRWPREGVGHLGFTGCSLWIDPARARWVVLLSNRVYPTRANEAIRQLRPALHDAIVTALDERVRA